jgi:hypothetical protein
MFGIRLHRQERFLAPSNGNGKSAWSP